MPAGEAGPARRLAVAGAAAQLGLMEAMQHRLGFVGEVYKHGGAGKLARASKLLTVAGGALLATRARHNRGAAVTGGALVLAGELALRWSVFRAGFQSARDPRYTVIPQKQRAGRSRPKRGLTGPHPCIKPASLEPRVGCIAPSFQAAPPGSPSPPLWAVP